FHDYPDTTIHTSADQPENLDATKLGRVAYMGAGVAYTLAALPDAEAPRLLQTAEAFAAARRAQAERRRAALDDPRDGTLAPRGAAAGAATAPPPPPRLWPPTAASVGAAVSPLPAAPVVTPVAGDLRVPQRSAEIKGPLDVYYYSHLAEVERGLTTPPAPPAT